MRGISTISYSVPLLLLFILLTLSLTLIPDTMLLQNTVAPNLAFLTSGVWCFPSFDSFGLFTFLSFYAQTNTEAARPGIIGASDIQSSKCLTDVARRHSWMCGAPGTRVLCLIPDSESMSSTVKCANTVTYHLQNSLLVAMLSTHLEIYSLWRIDGSTPWAEKPCHSPSEDSAEGNATHSPFHRLLVSESYLKESSLLPLASHHSSISCLENPTGSQWGHKRIWDDLSTQQQHHHFASELIGVVVNASCWVSSLEFWSH